VRFDDIPIIDNHAHPMLPPEAAAKEPFARYFTEGHDAELISNHVPHTLFYRHALRELAGFLGCEATEEAVVAARAARPFEEYLRSLLADVGVEAVLLDDGYPRTGALTVAETARAGGVRARRVLRIERLLEDLIPSATSLLALGDAFVRELHTARPSLAAIKSIIAYRCGLMVEPPSNRAGVEAAEQALEEVQRSWSGEPGRLASKPLLDHLLAVAASWAWQHGIPLHLHTGFGDRDVDLRLANPLHLRPLLEERVLSPAESPSDQIRLAIEQRVIRGPVHTLRGPVVLLHAGYPYVREAAYMASVYPNVYVDISEAAPLLAGPGLTRVLEELLALAPVTKILYGSDAWGIPEWFWLAARAVRSSLAEALAWLPESEQQWAARRILRDNAAELHGI
jgi:uncharacterized protein